MRITELGIANFRCFKRAELRVAPVTLITGANSAGKSSLVAPLLAWAQTDGMPALLSPNGRYVEMGGFSEMVHGRGENRAIGVGFELQTRGGYKAMLCTAVFGPDDASSGLRLSSLLIRGRHYKLSIRAVDNQYEVEYEFGPHDLVQLAKMINEIREPPSPWSDALLATTAGNWFDWRIGDPADDTREVRASGSNKLEKGKLPLSAPIDFVRTMRGLSGSGSFMPYYVTLLAGIVRDRVSYMSSFRHAPQRTYYEVAMADLAAGRHGENYVAQITHWQSQDAPEIDFLRQDLAELGLLSTLEVGRLGAGRMELRGRPRPSSRLTNLTDLGFGTSQLLPVLVAINQLSPGSVFVVDQPEIHLHPEAQARLASYFVRLAKERSITFIVETHSEYLINRLRRLVAEGDIAEEDVSVAHVANSGKEAKLHPVELRADGQIVGAPNDFFETYMMDVMKLAMGS